MSFSSGSTSQLLGKPQQIRQAQEHAYKTLPENSLFVVLQLRAFPHEAGNFHWSFYDHRIGEHGGFERHATNADSITWRVEHEKTKSVFKVAFLCVLVQVAVVPPEKTHLVEQIMHTFDTTVNDIPSVTCRIWFMKVFALLVERGIIKCSNLTEAEQDFKRIGDSFAPGAVNNDQPRPVVRSSYVQL